MNFRQGQGKIAQSLNNPQLELNKKQWFSSGNTPGLDVYRSHCEQVLVWALKITFPLCLSIVGGGLFSKTL